MITLKAFGTLDLRQDESRPLQAILTQPKRLALLVYLAVATPRGSHRREILLALLWPELDETRARAGLNRAVHHVRSSLGDDVLVSQGQETLGLDWSHFWSDVAGFEDALDRGELAEALALYRGPLLPGFFVDEAPGFDRWLEGERTRLQQRAVLAARQLSETEEAEGRLIPAIEWARRAVTLAPQDEAALRRLMLLLEQGSDRAGAIRVYEEFARELERELGVEPAAETRALCDEIRARSAGPVRVAMAAPSPGLPAPVPVVILSNAKDLQFGLAAKHAGAASPPRSGSTVRRAAIAGISFAAGIGVLWAASRYTASGSTPADEQTVGVAVFSTAGDRATPALADSLRDQLRAQLDSAPSVRALAAPTRRSTRFVIVGTIASAGDRLTVVASLQDSMGSPDPIGRAAVEGAPGENARLTQDLAWQLVELTATRGQVGMSDMNIAPRQARSAAALDAEREGQGAYIAGRFDDAVRSFRRAVEIDSTFGIAYLHLSMAAQWENRWDIAQWASAMAMRRLATFAPLDQFRARAWDAYVRARPRDAERLFRIVLANNPGDGDAWYALGEVLFHWGPGLGWPLADARRAFEVTDSLGSTNMGVFVHLARIAAMQGDRPRVDANVARALTFRPDATQTLELRALRAFSGQSATAGEQDRVVAQLGKADDRLAQSVATMVAVSAADNDRTSRLLDVLSAPARAAPARGAADILRASLDIGRGRWDGVSRFASSRTVSAARIVEYRAVFATLPFVAVPRDTLDALRSAVRQLVSDERIGLAMYDATLGILPIRRRYLLGLLSARLGDRAAASMYADSLERPPFANSSDREFRVIIARVLRATMLRAEGKPADALAMLGEPVVSPDHVLPGILSYPVADERFLRAELLLDLRRDDEALRWYGTFPDAGGYDLPYLAPALFRQAEVAARRGDRGLSDTLRARAEALWANAGPPFSDWRSAARGRIDAR